MDRLDTPDYDFAVVGFDDNTKAALPACAHR